MISQKIFDGEDNKLTFYQCQSKEEAQEHGCPEGVYFYWIWNGQKIFNPGQIVNIVQKQVMSGKFAPEQFTSPEAIQEYYKKLYTAQKQQAIDALSNMESQLADENVPQAVRDQAMKQVKQMREFYNQQFPMASSDGIFRPTREQAETIFGKESIDRVFTDEQQRELFDK